MRNGMVCGMRNAERGMSFAFANACSIFECSNVRMFENFLGIPGSTLVHAHTHHNPKRLSLSLSLLMAEPILGAIRCEADHDTKAHASEASFEDDVDPILPCARTGSAYFLCRGEPYKRGSVILAFDWCPRAALRRRIEWQSFPENAEPLCTFAHVDPDHERSMLDAFLNKTEIYLKNVSLVALFHDDEVSPPWWSGIIRRKFEEDGLVDA